MAPRAAGVLLRLIRAADLSAGCLKLSRIGMRQRCGRVRPRLISPSRLLIMVRSCVSEAPSDLRGRVLIQSAVPTHVRLPPNCGAKVDIAEHLKQCMKSPRQRERSTTAPPLSITEQAIRPASFSDGSLDFTRISRCCRCGRMVNIATMTPAGTRDLSFC